LHIERAAKNAATAPKTERLAITISASRRLSLPSCGLSVSEMIPTTVGPTPIAHMLLIRSVNAAACALSLGGVVVWMLANTGAYHMILSATGMK
jgi:hypothetical protein